MAADSLFAGGKEGKEEKATAKHRILVVDDDRDLLLGLHVRLSANGYEVSTANGAALAMALIKQRHPDLVLLDLIMPGADGFSVLRQVKNLPVPRPSVVVLTARDPQAIRDKALSAGARAFLQKPADNEELLETIALILAPRQATRVSLN